MRTLEAWAADPASLHVPVLLLHGCRRPGEQPYVRRLAELAALLPRLQLLAFHSMPVAGAQGARAGRISAADVPSAWIAQRACVYVCGPAPMARELIAGLVARGVPRHDVFSEAFSHSPEAPPSNPLGRQVRFTRTGTHAAWVASDTSLLALAERLGVPLSGGCRVGQCETCRITLRSGQVWHRGDTPALQANECLACLAVPVTDLEIDA